MICNRLQPPPVPHAVGVPETTLIPFPDEIRYKMVDRALRRAVITPQRSAASTFLNSYGKSAGNGMRRETSLLQKKGFTLIELLIVIVIMGVLSGLLLSALQQARARARRYKAAAEVRELSKAWQAFYMTYQTLPSDTSMNQNMVMLLQGNNSVYGGINARQIKFMDFPPDANTTTGFKDPWGNVYNVTLSAPSPTTNSTYKTRVYLVNRQAYLYE